MALGGSRWDGHEVGWDRGERVGRALLGLDFRDAESLRSGREVVMACAGKTVRAVKEVSLDHLGGAR